MPRLIPQHTVILARPHKDKRKDKEGNVVHERVTVPMNKPFDFTPAEVEDLKASGHALIVPGDQSTSEMDDHFIGTAEDADRVAAEAAAAAEASRTAALDAANTARAGAKGQAKPPVAKSGTADSAKQAPGAAEDEEEL